LKQSWSAKVYQARQSSVNLSYVDEFPGDFTFARIQRCIQDINHTVMVARRFTEPPAALDRIFCVFEVLCTVGESDSRGQGALYISAIERIRNLFPNQDVQINLESAKCRDMSAKQQILAKVDVCRTNEVVAAAIVNASRQHSAQTRGGLLLSLPCYALGFFLMLVIAETLASAPVLWVCGGKESFDDVEDFLINLSMLSFPVCLLLHLGSSLSLRGPAALHVSPRDAVASCRYAIFLPACLWLTSVALWILIQTAELQFMRDKLDLLFLVFTRGWPCMPGAFLLHWLFDWVRRFHWRRQHRATPPETWWVDIWTDMCSCI